MKNASQNCVNETLRPLLIDALAQEMPEEVPWRLEQDHEDPDRQTLLFFYPTVFADPLAYVSQVVKIEMGARSDTEPTQEIIIRPYLADAFRDLLDKPDCPVQAVSPQRTFWEKAMLLHEETFRPFGKIRKARMARHYYDLYRLIKAGIGDEAAADLALFERIAGHRQVYFRYSWVDYNSLRPGRLMLVPSEGQLAEWKSDYSAMRNEMFLGYSPEFNDLLETVRAFQERFNRPDNATPS